MSEPPHPSSVSQGPQQDTSTSADNEGTMTAVNGPQHLTLRPLVNREDDEDQADLEDQDYGIATNVPPTQEEKKKKRRKKKPASKRGLGKPSGFEDFFADAPLTPEDYAEEQDLYSPDLHFVDRILTAIARFERTRKLTPERRDVFYKYLAYGGLTVGPKVGQGGQNTQGMDKTEVAMTLSQVFASQDKHDLGTETSLYAVDFLGCAKSFLSRHAKYVFGMETKDQVECISTTLERFLDYLLQHDVCPEYRDEVLATRALCRQATTELWDLAEATRRLPGDFNIACSTLFDGFYSRNYDGETWWGNQEEGGPVFVGMSPEEAQQVVKFGVAGAAPEKVYMGFLDGIQGITPSMMEVVNVQTRTAFEITRIDPPTRACKQIYTSQSQHFRPVGRVHAKPWTNPAAPPEDLTEAEGAAAAATNHSSPDKAQPEYVFFIEAILQSMLRVGTKIEATIRTLGCGIMFFDEVVDVFPSFDECIANDMMVGWTAPRPAKGALDYISEEDGEGEDGNESGEEGRKAANPAPGKADGD